MISRELKEAEFNRAPEEDYEILHRVETKKNKNSGDSRYRIHITKSQEFCKKNENN